jgi:hypothetical protein
VKSKLTLPAEREPLMRIAQWTILAALSIAPFAGAQSSPQRMPGDFAGQLAPAPAPASIANTPDPVIGAVVSAVMPKGLNSGYVKGVPFSATQTTVHEQTLVDGTVIKSTVEVLLARDGEGRMRAEGTTKSSSGAASQTRVVAVWNPIDRKEMTWISGNQSANFATVVHLPEMQINGMMGALASVPPPPPPPPGVLSRPQQALAAPPSHLNPDTGNIHTETLPADTIAGLDVAGTRTTQVIPAGTVDNDRDMTVLSETWTSPELGYIVRQMTSDPRTGKITTELSNIDRSEPDPAQFKLPEGYKVVDAPSR